MQLRWYKPALCGDMQERNGKNGIVMIRRRQRIHMVGIAGAGMNPVAELLHTLGYAVTGSDRQKSGVSQRLESLGIAIQYDHTPNLILDSDIVVYSSAVRKDNPERVFAESHGKIIMRRAEMLGDLMRMQPTICVSGTHGKTTTTSLTGMILHNAGLRPTVLAGGALREGGAHALIGNGNIMVAEADEYDRSFLAMYPAIAIITNIDADHLDCYRDIDDIKSAFTAFTTRVPFYGSVIACVDDAGVRDVIPAIDAHVITYAIDREADYRAIDVEFIDGFARFDILEHGIKAAEGLRLAIPGLHNVRNALAAFAAARLFDVDTGTVQKTLLEFRGVKRRFEVAGTIDGMTVVDDYAHHPREIQATIDAARQIGCERVVAIFQPHLFSRTRDFLDDFAEVLSAADIVCVTDIYRSREEPIPGVTAMSIVDRINSRGHENAHYIADCADLAPFLLSLARSGDYMLFMGAGDIGAYAYRLVEAING